MWEILRSTFLAVVLPLVTLYVAAPLLIYCFPHFMQHIFFLNFVKVPWTDYANLTLHGVRSLGRNFYLEEKEAKELEAGERKPRLGVWHILPASLSATYAEKGTLPTELEMEELLDKGPENVVVYLHGNSFDRTTKHRCELYNVLSALGFHVLAIDYRGYGDSTGRPSEAGVVEDAHAIYNYARRMAPTKNVFVWGHSMGTGVASRTVAELSDAGRAPEGLVLESPFNNLRDVITHHPFSTPFRWLPRWAFDAVFVNPLIRTGLVMSSDQRLVKVTCPIFIMHAQDDHIIPVKLGRKLAEVARGAGKEVDYVEFEAERQFKHKFIHRSEELPKIVTGFFNKCQTWKRSKNRSA
ncbi:Protein Y97E10AL.2 [Aphelenchoides avenae]|nr:Protein Y97E10AL.2 [Aphelenchus avenae]